MKAKIKHAFAKAANTYDHSAHLQQTVGKELLSQIDKTELKNTVLDLGCGTGFLTHALIGLPQQLIALDLAEPMLQRTRTKLTNKHNSVEYLCADAEYLALKSHSIHTIVSNLVLQWCQPLSIALNECKRVLTANGRLYFSIFGSETLQELKQAWRVVDKQNHVNAFYTQEQLFTCLQTVGFADIEIQPLCYVSRYDSVLSLLQELKQLGAHSVLTERRQALLTRSALQNMFQAYPKQPDGTVLATFEVFIVSARV